MNETVIIVQGHNAAWYPPERATVQLSIGFDGPDRQSVFDATTRAAETVRSMIVTLGAAQPGPISRWSSDSVSVWNERPWNNEGKQLALVFHATIGFTVRFNDFEVMTRWLDAVAAVDSVTVGGIEWSLTAVRKAAVFAEAQSLAVADAVTRATVYARSLGLESVRAIALADPGMLGDHGSGPAPGPLARGAMMMADSRGGRAELALTPQRIEVSASVDARFVAA
ncbi:SIMPL domain-containing protein [Leifsonia kafniensis]|uniref:SIMPL domain-containing protein n=1 Tax=Leifsonia kafniensis TaxID=475957 RepID=A0ABP7KWD5_9MICO